MTANKNITANFGIVTANSVTLYAADSGWYDMDGYGNPMNANYYSGYSGSYYRNWFAFNIPQLSRAVMGAKLYLNAYNLNAAAGEVTYQLNAVSTPAVNVEGGGTGLTAIYNDLADGTRYADRTFIPSQADRFQSIPLNDALRSTLDASYSQTLVMGGFVVTNLNGNSGLQDGVFGASQGTPGDVQLVMTFTPGVPVVGYFTDDNPTSTGPDTPVTRAGFTPLRIGDISTQDFSGLRLLVVQETSNSGKSTALANRLADIQNWVKTGGRLIVHDRSAGNVNPNLFLPGYAGTPTVRLTVQDLDVVHPANSLVAAGPFGLTDNLALDNGNSSAHGYVPATNLPPGSVPILTIGGNSNQVVCFSYPYGAGYVYYSSIPADYYLDGGTSGGAIDTNLPSIYMPNVLVYMNALNPLLRFMTASRPVAGSLQLFLANLDGSAVAAERMPNIQVYATTNPSLPFGSWTLLGNPMVLTNGLLRIDGVGVAGSARFFRAVELP